MADPRRHPRPIRKGEQGFVLIAATWLLVLAGAVVALLMLRGLTDARDAKAEGELFRHKLALDGAVETVVADRLFNGSRSQWSRVPAQGSVDVDGIAVRARSTSESGRLDLNVADLALVDRALQGLGVGATNRRIVLGRLQQLRGRNEKLSSFAALEALLSQAQQDTTVCLADMMTFNSGLAQPRPGQMPGKLSFALGVPAGAGDTNGRQFQPGEPQRLEVQMLSGGIRIVILRLTGQLGADAAASATSARALCAI